MATYLRSVFPSPLAKERIEGRYLGLVRDAMAEAGASHAELRLRIEPAEPPPLWTVPAPDDSLVSTAPGPLEPWLGGRCQGRRSITQRSHPTGRPAGRCGAQSPLHVRELRHRGIEQLRPRRRTVRGRNACPQVQPAVHLRPRRPRQDPPAPGNRQLRHPKLPSVPRALRHVGDVPQRVHRLDALGQPRCLQAPLPRHRRAAGRRRPVLRGQAGDARGVLPHVQPPAPDQPPDRPVLRPSPRPDRHRRPNAQPLPAGADDRHPAARRWRPGWRSC